MHTWGEEDFDWEGLNKAINYIDKWFRFWRIPVRQSKEKYGTARIYCGIGAYQIHDLTHPGHCFSRYPKWLWVLDCRYGRHIVKWLINWWLNPLHKIVYVEIYKRAVKKYPHIKEEITCSSDYYELLEKGGLSKW